MKILLHVIYLCSLTVHTSHTHTPVLDAGACWTTYLDTVIQTGVVLPGEMLWSSKSGSPSSYLQSVGTTHDSHYAWWSVCVLQLSSCNKPMNFLFRTVEMMHLNSAGEPNYYFLNFFMTHSSFRFISFPCILIMSEYSRPLWHCPLIQELSLEKVFHPTWVSMPGYNMSCSSLCVLSNMEKNNSNQKGRGQMWSISDRMPRSPVKWTLVE